MIIRINLILQMVTHINTLHHSKEKKKGFLTNIKTN